MIPQVDLKLAYEADRDELDAAAPPSQQAFQNVEPGSLGQFAYGSPEWEECERKAWPNGKFNVIPLIPLWWFL
jgi:hypothetical protein